MLENDPHLPIQRKIFLAKKRDCGFGEITKLLCIHFQWWSAGWSSQRIMLGKLNYTQNSVLNIPKSSACVIWIQSYQIPRCKYQHFDMSWSGSPNISKVLTTSWCHGRRRQMELAIRKNLGMWLLSANHLEWDSRIRTKTQNEMARNVSLIVIGHSAVARRRKSEFMAEVLRENLPMPNSMHIPFWNSLSNFLKGTTAK